MVNKKEVNEKVKEGKMRKASFKIKKQKQNITNNNNNNEQVAHSSPFVKCTGWKWLYYSSPIYNNGGTSRMSFYIQDYSKLPENSSPISNVPTRKSSIKNKKNKLNSFKGM